MKFLSIALKDLKELLRDRRGLAMILVFPLIFMLVFGFAFGGMGQSNQPHNLAVVNYDQGATLPVTGEQVNFGNNLTKILEDAKYENSEIYMFNVTLTNEDEADQKLKKQQVDATLIIPPEFSQSVVGLITNTITENTNPSAVINNNTVSTLIIRGDPGLASFGVTQGILVGILEKYQDNLEKNVKNTVQGTPNATERKFLESKVESIPGTEVFTGFDFLAPGMIVFAILLLSTTVAAGLTREVDTGTLARLKLTKMTSFDFLFGGLLPWTLIATAQVLILFLVAIAIGFHWQGGLNSLLLAILVGVLGGIASISLGMIIASFARNDRQAANLGTLISVPTSFLVGAFFQLPQIVLVELNGYSFQVYDLLPWTHVLNALRATLTFGGGWSDISYQVFWTVILTFILFLVGLILFSRNRLQADN